MALWLRVADPLSGQGHAQFPQQGVEGAIYVEWSGVAEQLCDFARRAVVFESHLQQEAVRGRQLRETGFECGGEFPAPEILISPGAWVRQAHLTDLLCDEIH